MEGSQKKQELVQRFAPILVSWPEIPAHSKPDLSIRDSYSRQGFRQASRPVEGAHISRDFHPCDVRQILDHAQPWEPTSPFPLVPLWLSRAYRDLARFFFWPIITLVLLFLLILAFAQGLPGPVRQLVTTGILVLAGILYLVTLRSPILAPVDYWHHLNHAVLGLGVVVAWGTVFGTRELWLVGPVIAIPTLLSFLTSIAMRIAAQLTNLILGGLQSIRGLLLRSFGDGVRRTEEPHTSYLFHGLKAAHEYTSRAELFYRDPRTRRTIHPSDQTSHWSAYSQIRARKDYDPVCYARVLDSDGEGNQIIQYWFCYFYNDWANRHEGDWESVVVFLRDGQPAAVAASQHERGEYRQCEHVQWRGERPVLYVAAGSHALYFEADAYLTERPIAGFQVTALDARLLGRDVLDFVDFTPIESGPSVTLNSTEVVLIPDPDPENGRWGHLEHNPDCPGGCRHDFEWLNFAGHWGAAAPPVNMGGSGPRGPAFSGLRWDNPQIWARRVCLSCRSCESAKVGNPV